MSDIIGQKRTALQNKIILRSVLENSFLRFVAYFSKQINGSDFLVNWHHILFANLCEQIYYGELRDVVINVAPRSSKSLLFSIMFPLWCFAKNPRCNFICTSFSEELVAKNSSQIKDIIASREWNEIFPGYSFKRDTNSKTEWIINFNDKKAGEYKAASMGGQLTGRGAGILNAETRFSGAIIIDDPMKPEDAWSDAKRETTNRVFSDTLRSRKSNVNVPVIMIMQRLHSEDCTDFLVTKRGMGFDFKHIVIPAKIDYSFIETLPEDIKKLALYGNPKWGMEGVKKDLDEYGYASFWNKQLPLDYLESTESASSYTWASQYMQNPTPAGGTVFKIEWWIMEDELPNEFDYVKIVADTAMKVKKENDYSVLLCYGVKDNNIYILNLKRGKWEAPELFNTTNSFYNSAKNRFGEKLRGIHIEDKSSGVGLIQSLKKETRIPVFAVQREKDKFSRAMAAQNYIASGRVHVPKNMKWTQAFLMEMSQFTKNDTHAHDDIVDCLITAVELEFIRPNKASIKCLSLY